MSADWTQEILDFWFAQPKARWWTADDDFDAEIRKRFLRLWETERQHPASNFLGSADRALAAVILFDQFPRNMFRDQARAFATDALAREIADGALAQGFDEAFVEMARPFFYMPFMHSEALADQDRSLALFSQPGQEESLAFAKMHYDVIARFGRFPHRNAALGRDTLPAEEAAIADGAHW